MSLEVSSQEWICIGCGAEVEATLKQCPQCGSSSDPLEGRILAGKYKLLRKIAGGGMGVVYLAEHTRLKYKKYRAIKILKDQLLQNNTLRKRFLREVELTHLVSQDNPHIVHIHDDYGFESGIGFYVMEYLEGDTLEQRIRKAKGTLSFHWIRTISLQICNAIASIHHANIIHRDLKPANIFLVKDKAGNDFVKVMDFGIAKAENGGTQHTKEGSIVGTAQYLAPEQIRLAPGQVLDARCDIYALGCILFEMLTGRTPFILQSSTVDMGGSDDFPMALQALAIKHLTETPPSPLEFRNDIPHDLVQLIHRMLAKYPNQRPQSIEELAQELRQINWPEEDPAALATGLYEDSPSNPQLPQHRPYLTPAPPHATPQPDSFSTDQTLAASPPTPISLHEVDGFSEAPITDEPPNSTNRAKHLVFLAVIAMLIVGGAAYSMTYLLPGEQPPSQPDASTVGAIAPPRPVRPRVTPRPDRPSPTPTQRPDSTPPPERNAVRPQPRVRPRTKPRTRPRPRIRRLIRRGTRPIKLIASTRFFKRFRFRFSPRRSAVQRGNRLYLKRSSVQITVQSKHRVFAYYRCTFRVTKRTRTLTLSPLLSKSELSPDSHTYCVKK